MSQQVNHTETYTIKDLADEFHVTARTLRHYEQEGLISPAREGTARVYSTGDRARLAWILRGKRVGFSLAEIAEMLALYDLGDGREKQRKVTLQKCRTRITALEAQRNDIDATIRELAGFVALLDRIEYDATSKEWVDPNTGDAARHHLVQVTRHGAILNSAK